MFHIVRSECWRQGAGKVMMSRHVLSAGHRIAITAWVAAH